MADPSQVFINPSFSLADVEENKVVRMYASINVKVLGLAMNLAGGVGPLNTLLCKGYSGSIILYYIIIWHKLSLCSIYI